MGLLWDLPAFVRYPALTVVKYEKIDM